MRDRGRDKRHICLSNRRGVLVNSQKIVMSRNTNSSASLRKNRMASSDGCNEHTLCTCIYMYTQ